MSVYLLKKPIIWDTKLVKTVFLLNLGLESEKLLEGLQFFYQMIKILNICHKKPIRRNCINIFLKNITNP